MSAPIPDELTFLLAASDPAEANTSAAAPTAPPIRPADIISEGGKGNDSTLEIDPNEAESALEKTPASEIELRMLRDKYLNWCHRSSQACTRKLWASQRWMRILDVLVLILTSSVTLLTTLSPHWPEWTEDYLVPTFSWAVTLLVSVSKYLNLRGQVSHLQAVSASYVTLAWDITLLLAKDKNCITRKSVMKIRDRAKDIHLMEFLEPLDEA
eukprot:comp17315_c0_seq1/m.16495 comp17315_c0_seq1/g.16495  ORF comp17315_c0_seq1/g.16495 comp17315_c0_seq1/m.16495 type:complete len:212 (-) comp17315_c0_seq1:310-945(-)